VLEYKDDNGNPVRNHKKIALKYFHNGFLRDSICLFPLTYFVDPGPDHANRHYLCYLIKMIRVIKGIGIFNPAHINKYFQNIQMERI